MTWTGQINFCMCFQSGLNSDIIGIKPLICVRIGPDMRSQPCDPRATTLGQPEAATLCLAQPGPKPKALFFKQKQGQTGELHMLLLFVYGT